MSQSKLTACFFGACGTGKSTDLNLISAIYSTLYLKHNQTLTFKAAKDTAAVTIFVDVKRMDHLTLIDTPGTNDPNKKRPDNSINFEIVNKIRDPLSDPTIGINTFTQCVMPNAAGRIENSVIDSMSNFLLSMSSLYEELDPDRHPRMCIIFNNVSKNIYPEKLIPKYGMTSD